MDSVTTVPLPFITMATLWLSRSGDSVTVFDAAWAEVMPSDKWFPGGILNFCYN